MEGDSILDAIYEEDDLEDVEMLDAEEGEIVDQDARKDSGQSVDGDAQVSKQETQSKNRRRRANRKKNKRKRSAPGSKFTDINRFVIDTCRRLKEKKSYMVYTAVGCLGISALSDLLNEVDAILVCGGQMTADGKRQRTGGGILWNIIKSREPNAYKEIMKRAKEFEKQFKQQNIQRGRDKEASSYELTEASPNGNLASIPDESSKMLQKNVDEQVIVEEKRQSVKDRLRVPVSYDDVLDGPNGEAS